MDDQFLNISTLKWNLDKSFNIIRNYDWLVDSYVLDFYVNNHWSQLPSSWRNCFRYMPPEHLCFLLETKSNVGENVNRVWPLSLLVLKQCFRQLCVKREQKQQSHLPRSPLLSHPKLKHLFDKGVKPKKRHELDCMAALCQQICLENPVDFVIDFGAGLGHLARVLGFAYNIKVCCLEMQTALNNQAYELDKKLTKLIEKYMPATGNDKIKQPIHVNLCLTAEMTTNEFLKIIEKALELETDNYTFGIIGLHPCGNLGAILMRMFLQCKQAKFLSLVGCCYQKLTCLENSNRGLEKSIRFCGYPLSEYLETCSKDTRLSYESREISCHAMELYQERLNLKDYEYLKVHSFRAAAERIIVKYFPELRHSGLKSVKHTANMKFQDYFYKAVRGLPVENLNEQDLNSPVTQDDLLEWKNIVVFYTLRLFFAPLIESILLYDRLLYLLENGCKVQLSPIFNPRLSPRNNITIAVKNS